MITYIELDRNYGDLDRDYYYNDDLGLHRGKNKYTIIKILSEYEKLYWDYKELEQEKDKQKELIDKIKATTPLELAIMFHDTYEELAPKFNYETRKDTKEFDENSNNGKLMIAVCSKLLDLIKEYEDDSKTNV